MKKIKHFAVLAATTFGIFTVTARAASADLGDENQAWDIERLTSLARVLETFLLAVGGILAAIFIIWGGITYMFAGGDEEKSKKAKTRIWNGIIGAIIVFGVFIIIATIKAVLQGSALGD